MQRTLLVTVGSTKFDELIDKLKRDSKDFKKFLAEKSIDKVIIQHGKSKAPVFKGIDCVFEIVDYLEPCVMAKLIKESTIIISHGGAGTIFEVLRSENGNLETFIVIENESLMDSHQSELIESLLELKCPIIRAKLTSNSTSLFETSVTEDGSNVKLPDPNYSLLISLINSYLK